MNIDQKFVEQSVTLDRVAHLHTAMWELSAILVAEKPNNKPLPAEAIIDGLHEARAHVLLTQEERVIDGFDYEVRLGSLESMDRDALIRVVQKGLMALAYRANSVDRMRERLEG